MVVRLDATGARDPSFGADGVRTIAVTGNHDAALAVGVQADGKIVAAGGAGWTRTVPSRFAAVRLLADGSLDPSFSGDGIRTAAMPIRNSGANGLAIQPDGKLVLVGAAGGQIAVARWNTDGSWDASFSADGRLTTRVTGHGDAGNAVALQSDGNIVVAAEVGYKVVEREDGRPSVQRLMSDQRNLWNARWRDRPRARTARFLAIVVCAGSLLAVAGSVAAQAQGTDPGELLVDAAHGHVFAAPGSGSGGVDVYDLDGVKLTTLDVPNADGLAVAGGTLFVAPCSSGDTISRFDLGTLAPAAPVTVPGLDATCKLTQAGGRVWFYWWTGHKLVSIAADGTVNTFAGVGADQPGLLMGLPGNRLVEVSGTGLTELDVSTATPTVATSVAYTDSVFDVQPLGSTGDLLVTANGTVRQLAASDLHEKARYGPTRVRMAIGRICQRQRGGGRHHWPVRVGGRRICGRHRRADAARARRRLGHRVWARRSAIPARAAD